MLFNSVTEEISSKDAKISLILTLQMQFFLDIFFLLCDSKMNIFGFWFAGPDKTRNLNIYAHTEMQIMIIFII